LGFLLDVLFLLLFEVFFFFFGEWTLFFLHSRREWSILRFFYFFLSISLSIRLSNSITPFLTIIAFLLTIVALLLWHRNFFSYPRCIL
jgi:hypothetical protein